LGQRNVTWRVIAILLLALAASLSTPVYAHTTLGDLNNSPPIFRTNDNELNTPNFLGNHVPGPLGYVWPGAGLDAYSGSQLNPPGYQPPFGSTINPPVQDAADAYSPEGAILTSTPDHDNVGDFIFAINFSLPNTFTQVNDFNYSSLTIYLPAPVFDKTGLLVQDGFEPAAGINWDHGDNSNIVTTITDNYGAIFVTRADSNDPFEPGSWIVRIQGPPSGITFFKTEDVWYYVRINQMKAPYTAGRYFFKMFLNDSYPIVNGASGDVWGTMPMENWPVLLVKGEVDPAIITGTIRYGEMNSTLYGLPINLPGRVRAIGTAVDPLTGQSTGRPVEARGYFNATAKGHYEIEGLAAGVYTIYASAAGLPEQKIADNVQVNRGQSLHIDGYLRIGPQLRGAIFSKQGFGAASWPAQRPISIVIYNSKSYDSASIETSSPINLTQSPYTSYVTGNTFFSAKSTEFSGLDPSVASPKKVAFPWEGPTSYYSYTTPGTKDPYGLFNGVGPAQVWWVDPRSSLDSNTGLGSASSEFVFQFGSEDVYGVPTKFSGMVPQVFATWTDSLSPGTYYVRAYLNGYVQTGYDGTLLIDYPFDVPYIGPSNVFIPIDLVESCGVNVTVHFHDLPGSLVDDPIQGPDPARYLIAEAFTRDGFVAAFNFTQVHEKSEATILLNGLGMAGDPLNILPFDPRAPIKYSLFRYRGLYDYGLPTDMYTIRVFMRGYIQALPPATSIDELDQPLTVNLAVGTCLSEASTHMFRGGSINATVSSIDWEIPTVERNWVWNNTSVNLLVYDISSQNFIAVINFWNANLQRWYIPRQDSMFKSLPWSGWLGSYGPGSSYLMTNGSVEVDQFGPDLPNIPSANPGTDLVTLDVVQNILHEGFLYNFSSYRLPTFRSSLAIYPGTYALNGWTYGYVQENVLTLGDLGNVYVAVPWLGDMADVNLKVIVGVNLTLTMLFKTEHVIEGTPYNSSVRIRVFDDADNFIAATTLIASDVGTLLGRGGEQALPGSNAAGFFANGIKLVDQAVPAGTTVLTYRNLAGSFGYVELNSQISSIRSATLFSSDHGIWGRSTIPGGYSGDWTVMVDFVNWYQSTSWYPPVPALLQGESVFFFPYNHLGPYSENGFIRVSNAPLSGEASAEFELDLRGYIQGIVLGMNWDDATRTVSWANLQIVDNSSYQYYWYTLDGWFDGYLNPGNYQVTIREWIGNQGHLPIKFVLNVSPGEQSRSLNFILAESQIPIPEFPDASSVALVLIMAAFLILRRRRR
jgi:hypothetical protein